MNYTARYSLEFNPFIKNSKEILIETSQYKEVRFRLDYLLQTKGFGLITGEPGNGKTTSIRNWANSLNPSAYKIIYLPLSTLTVLETYRQLAMSLGMEPRFRKHENFENIQSAIRRTVIEKKVTPIIIMDEANYLSSQALNDLKILFNFDMDSKDMAVIILSGLPILNNILNMRSNEPLRQRIITSYNIEGLSIEEAKKYIRGKLKAAGCHSEIFSEAALQAICSYASGNPRVLSRICNTCLLIGDQKGASTIDEEVVTEAINEVEL